MRNEQITFEDKLEKLGKLSSTIIEEWVPQNKREFDKNDLKYLIETAAKDRQISITPDELENIKKTFAPKLEKPTSIDDFYLFIVPIVDELEEIKIKKSVKIGDVASVPFGNKFLVGIVKDVNLENIMLDNYKSKEIIVPNNNKVYKFFPGQKFDIREFEKVDENSPEKLSLKEKLNKFLSKTDVGSYNNLIANHKGDLVQLLKGQMTNTMFDGQSIITNPEGKQELKNWSCKFQLFRGTDGNLKLNTAWKQEQLQTKVYGVELTPEQLKNTMEKNQSVVIERETKDQVPFKAFCKYDKELNSFVTSQYDVKIDERMKASYSKREDLKMVEESKNEPKNIFKEKNEAAAAKEEKPEVKKGKGRKM